MLFIKVATVVLVLVFVAFLAFSWHYLRKNGKLGSGLTILGLFLSIVFLQVCGFYKGILYAHTYGEFAKKRNSDVRVVSGVGPLSVLPRTQVWVVESFDGSAKGFEALDDCDLALSSSSCLIIVSQVVDNRVIGEPEVYRVPDELIAQLNQDPDRFGCRTGYTLEFKDGAWRCDYRRLSSGEEIEGDKI